MHAKLLYFYPTTVKYSVLTGSWTSIALDSTACYTNLIFTLADLREICKKKVLGRCGPVASFTETCPSWAGLCCLGSLERFLRRTAPRSRGWALQLRWWQGLPLLSAAPEGWISPAHSCWEAAALQRSRVVFWAFRNHFDYRADLNLGWCLVWSFLSTKSVLRLWDGEQNPLVSFKH